MHSIVSPIIPAYASGRVITVAGIFDHESVKFHLAELRHQHGDRKTETNVHLIDAQAARMNR